MKPLLNAVCLATLLMTSAPSFAASVPELTRYFADSVQNTDQAVNQCSVDSNLPQAGESPEVWYFRRFWLRVRPKATFTIPMIAKLEIAPELELLWQR